MIRWLRENRQMVVRAFGSLLALALLIILIEEEGDGELFSAIRRVSPIYFGAALLALFLSRFFAVARWHVLLTSAGIKISFSQILKLTFTGNFSSNFLPTTIGGDVVRLGGAMQLGYDRAICLASLVADRLIGLIGMALVLPLGLIPALGLGPGSQHAWAFSAFLQKGIEFIKRTLASLLIWWQKPLTLLKALLYTLGNQFFIYVAIYLLLLGIQHQVSFWVVAGLYTLTYFVTLIPISINGLGVQELSLTFLLVQIGGLSSSESATIALLTRLLFVLASLPGALFIASILAVINDTKEQ